MSNKESNINVTINTADEKKKYSDVPALLKKAELTISTQGEYELANTVLKEVKTRYKELDTQRKDITQPLDAAKSNVMELFRSPLDLLKKAEEKIKNLMVGYSTEQERKAREAQLALQKIADAEAEKERKKLEAKIERAKASGKEEKAEELGIQKEMVVPIDVPVVAAAIETPKGLSYKDKFTGEVVDFKVLPDEYKIPNQKALDAIIQATKGAISIPGVKIHSEKIVSSRS